MRWTKHITRANGGRPGQWLFWTGWSAYGAQACGLAPGVILYLILLFTLFPGVAYAKRTRAPKVEPLVYGGVRYVAPNDNGRRGYIQAWDASTNKVLWSVTVFRNFINPFMEEDVQWVYIKMLQLEDGSLVVTDERDRSYTVDLKTQAVKGLRKIPSEKPKANQSGAGRAGIAQSNSIGRALPKPGP